MISRISSCLCLLICAAGAAAQTATQASDGRVLLRKDLGQGRQLLVTQSPVVPVTELKELLPREGQDRPPLGAAGIFSINVELRMASGASLHLWSRSLTTFDREDSEYPPEYDQYHVLDAAVLPKRILLAMTGSGSRIDVYDIAIGGQVRSHLLNTFNLEFATAARLPSTRDRLSAKFTYNEQDKKTQVEVAEIIGGTKLYTLFERHGDEGDFARVKQWHENAPPPQPAQP